MARAGRFSELQAKIERETLPIYNIRYKVRGYEVTVMKEVMMAIGLAGGPVPPRRLPSSRRKTKPPCTRQLPRSACGEMVASQA